MTPDERSVSAVSRAELTTQLAREIVRKYPSRSQADCYAAARAVVDRGDAYRDLEGRLQFTKAGARALPTVARNYDTADQSPEAKCARARAMEWAILGILPGDAGSEP